MYMEVVLILRNLYLPRLLFVLQSTVSIPTTEYMAVKEGIVTLLLLTNCVDSYFHVKEWSHFFHITPLSPKLDRKFLYFLS